MNELKLNVKLLSRGEKGFDMTYMKKRLTREEQLSRDRIRQLIDERCGGKQQVFADKVGIGKSSVSQYVNGSHSPTNVKAAQIAMAFGVQPMWVMGFDVPKFETFREDQLRRLSIYGRIAAGFDRSMVQDIIGEIDDTRYDPDEYMALQISGHSMEPRIEDGDIVIVKMQSDVETGNLAIITINGEDATCKRVKKYRDGIELIPINPSYPTRFFTHEEIQSLPVTIIGKVVELRAKF